MLLQVHWCPNRVVVLATARTHTNALVCVSMTTPPMCVLGCCHQNRQNCRYLIRGGVCTFVSSPARFAHRRQS